MEKPQISPHGQRISERARQMVIALKAMDKAGSHRGGAAGIGIAIVVLVFMSVVVQWVITNMTAAGYITGLAATVSQFVVPLMWVGGLVLAAKTARG